MAARAIFKATLSFEGIELPVKLVSAVRDTRVHFRLLSENTGSPIKQRMVDPTTEEVVSSEAIQRGFETAKGQFVLVSDEETEQVKPKPSRTIEVLRFVAPGTLSDAWYVRPYYLVPDGKNASYFALVDALASEKKEGIVRWTMRNKTYRGALRAEGDALILISLRSADEVVQAADLLQPEGRDLSKKELEMAEQLVGALTERFDREAYRDEYRARVEELVRKKARGETVKLRKAAPRAERAESLSALLQKSVKAAKEKRVA